MAARYFVDTPIESDRCLVSGQEARHISRVMRAKVGDRLTLFDGTGAEFDAEIQEIRRNDVAARILARREVDRELPRTLNLVVSLPKGDRQRWLVEKAVELGVGRLVPVVTARSVAQPSEKALGRLRRAVIEASKQCGRNRLMRIDAACDWTDVVKGAPSSATRWIAHPADRTTSAEPDSAVARFDSVDADSTKPVFMAVGPEGGFTEDEVALAAKHGWRRIDLGSRILRIETAALALTAIVAQRMTVRG